MTTPREALAVWLVPAAREREFFAGIIRDLATRFDAPVFAPHLTLHGGEMEPHRARAVLAKINAAESYELQVHEIGWCENYTKTLFVRFGLSAELRELRALVGEALSLDGTTQLDPHLSLLYKEMPLPAKEELAQTIKISFERITFDRMQLVAHPPRITRREDVEAWETRGERRLTSASE